MKDSDICLEAAELVDSGKHEYSCDAIGYAVGGEYLHDESSLLREKYGKIFSKLSTRFSSENWLKGFIEEKEQKNWRVLALLFFHEMLKSEGR